MKQTEKLDLILKALYNQPGRTGEVVSLLEQIGVKVTLDDAHVLGRRLSDVGYVRFTPTRDSAWVDMKSEGIEFVEESSFTQQGQSAITNNYVLPNILEVDSVKPVFKGERDMRDVFVTYAWDVRNPEYEDYVQRFVNFLRREEGYGAEMDKLLSQEETSLDFMKMMHKAMTDYKKVIIFLSPLYRQRAENFTGGVGSEYSLILRDIDANPSKYILVSTFGRSNDVVPLAFRNREVIELSDPVNSEQLNKLRGKLSDKKIYHFDNVAEKRAEVMMHRPKPLLVMDEIKVESITIKGIDAQPGNARLLYSEYMNVEFELRTNIRNESSVPITDFVLELVLPPELIQHYVHDNFRDKVYRVENGSSIFTYNIRKLAPNQSYSTPSLTIAVSNRNVKTLFEKSIIVMVFADSTSPQKEFLIKDLLWKNEHGEKVPLTKDDFYSGYER